MAVPPTIPTSFVPKQPVEMHPRQSQSGGNALMIVSLAILGIAVLLSAGIFAYGRYLSAQSIEKAAEIEKTQQGVSQETVEGYIRLSDRLRSADTLMAKHVALSQFFDVLESLTLKNVRFASLSITVEDDQSAELKMTGAAENFNALAAQSAAFAKESRIKQAIFSGIKVDSKTGVVSFSVSAKLDPRLVAITSAVPSAWNAPPAVNNATTAPLVASSTAGVTASTTAKSKAVTASTSPGQTIKP
jgi:hypothetical protein